MADLPHVESSGSRTHDPAAGPWYRGMTRYHWFVLVVAALGWLFDCLDQQLFNLARKPAMETLLAAADGSIDPKAVNFYGGLSTCIFMLGWATGGLIFGVVGDRLGRAKTMMITIVIYSVCTGLSALSRGFWDFAFYRFITGLGVGGEFAVGVALVAEVMPDRARPYALGLLQALSAVGNFAAALIGIGLGQAQIHMGSTIYGWEPWRWKFVIGALPAVLALVIRAGLEEPEKWRQMKAQADRTGAKLGGYGALFADPRWRRHAILGMLLACSGVIGLWGIGFFSPELVGDVIKASLVADGVPADQIAGQQQFWIGVNSIVQNIGAFLGMLLFTRLAQGIGRKAAFAIGYVAALVATVAFFQFFNGRGDIWMSAIMGGCQLALFAGFAIYLPELFPTSLRSTGTSFCYNVGRFVAASGPFTLGALQAALKAGATTPEAKLVAFRNACSYMSVIFLLGLVALVFLPETKGRPLPED